MAHRVFIASSKNSLSWARHIQEAMSNRMPNVQFKVWDQDIFQPSSSAIHDLIKTTSQSSAAIFVFSPDDDIVINGENKTITRDNVIFEYGLFVGHLGLDRTILITPENLSGYRLLSDVSGLTTIRFSFQAYDNDDCQSALGPTANRIERKLTTCLNSDVPLSLATLQSVGLSSATLETAHSTFSYVEAINASNTQFMLLGVGADKVTSNHQQFVSMIQRIIDNGGLVRLLLLDPDSYSRLGRNNADISGSNSISEKVKKSLIRVDEIITQLQCRQHIQIRSYFAINHDQVPPFRLTIIDDRQCIVSPRSLDDDNQARLQPQLVFANAAGGGGTAYYGAFKRYFESLWRQAYEETPQSMIEKINTLSKRTALIGCVHGRFQPPHKGHLNYILKAKAKCEMLYIGITQPDNVELNYCHIDAHRSDPENNPLSYYERAECLRRMLAEQRLYERKHYIIIPFDIDQPEMLKRYIPKTWVQFTTLIDRWNIEKNKTLEKHGYEIQSVADRREDEKVSGTAIRNLVRRADDSYKEMISSGVLDFLEKIKFASRLCSM